MERNDKKEQYRTNRIIFYTEKKFLRYDRAILPIVVFFCFLVEACELAAGGVVGTGEEVIPEEVVRAVELLAVTSLRFFVCAPPPNYVCRVATHGSSR